MKLGTAKRKPKFREERKNEAIICRKCLPHHKRASSFVNTYTAARLHFLPMLSRYSWMSERVQHYEQCSSLHDRWCFRYDEQRSSLHAEGLIPFHFMWKLWNNANPKNCEENYWGTLCVLIRHLLQFLFYQCCPNMITFSNFVRQCIISINKTVIILTFSVYLLILVLKVCFKHKYITMAVDF